MIKRLLKALPVIVLASCFTLILDHYGWLRSFETGALDRFFLLREKVPAHDVVLVEIDDADYLQLFHETSPLDPPTISDVIDAIAKNEPRLIAIDIDTSAAVFRNVKVLSQWPPVVWARGAHQEDKSLVLEGILGNNDRHQDLTSGIAVMPVDSDSKIRHFQREYLATLPNGKDDSIVRVDSFHWAIVKKYCEIARTDDRCKKLFAGEVTREAADQDLILNLAIDPYAFDPHIRVSQVLDQANTGNPGGVPPLLLSMKDKIVLLGGNYAAASDYHLTGNGTESGTELAAIAIESELSGTRLRHASHFVLVIAEVIAGLALVFLNYFFPIGWKHLLALASIPVLALLGSWIVFSSLALWVSFVPTLIATQFHRLYDSLAETKRLKKEVVDLKAAMAAHKQDSRNGEIEDPMTSETVADNSGKAEKEPSAGL
jgi:CHASE2 domain-containing sensor protein